MAGGRCYHVHCFTCDTCGRGLEPATARADREEGGLRCGHCCNNNNNTSGAAADVTLIKPSKCSHDAGTEIFRGCVCSRGGGAGVQALRRRRVQG